MTSSGRGKGGPPGIRINSVNTQGRKSDILTKLRQTLERSGQLTLAAIQEGGKPPWQLQPHPTNPNLLVGQISHPRAGSGRKPVYAVAQIPVGRKNPHPMRNTQMILSNEPILEAMELDAGHTGPGLRPPLVVETKNAVVATVHQPSGKPKLAVSQAAKQWAELKKMADRKRKAAAMTGDFNASRQQLAAALPAGTQLLTPPRSTHQSGGTLDHGIASTPATVRQGTAMAGDHTFQEFEMEPATKRRKLQR